MSTSLLNLLKPSTFKFSSLCPYNSVLFSPSQASYNLFSSQTLKIPSKRPSSFSPLGTDYLLQNDDEFVDRAIGDCLVFEEGVFEDPYLQNDVASTATEKENGTKHKGRRKKRNNVVEVEPENLVPEKWRDVQEEMNLSKNQKRKIAREIEFGRRVEKKKQGYMPLRSLNLKEYLAYKEGKLAQLKPLVLDNPTSFPDAGESGDDDHIESEENVNVSSSSGERLAPKNPKWAVYGRGLDDVSEFFNSGIYQPPDKKAEGRRRLFTKEEKVLLNTRLPDLATATCKKWLPLHTLAASGEFYFVDTLLKHNVDINAMDKDGLTALHKAIIGKKMAVTNYLLRESANPFVRDEDGATLLHYAVQTASNPAIKILLLYNVDINLQDNDGWTPLHLAVQARRTDTVKLLLIKGADKTLKTRDGLTPLDLCLYSGRDTRTFELIKLLKQLPKPQRLLQLQKT